MGDLATGKHISFGGFPANMTDAESWGFGGLLGDDEPVVAGFPTSTTLRWVVPDTGTSIELSGAFDVAALLREDYSTSSASSVQVNVAGGGLLVRIESDVPMTVSSFLEDDAGFSSLFIAGDDSIRGGEGNDTLDGGLGNDATHFPGTPSQYPIHNSGAAIVVSGGNDGTDTLYAFEYLQFADQGISLVPIPRQHPPDYGKDNGFLFDAVYYLLNNPDLVPTLTLDTALQNYLGSGAAEHRAPNSWFDPAYYANKWADLAPLHLDEATLFMHYNLYGVWEGRSGGPAFDQFDGNRYLAENLDVAAYVDANVADFLNSRSNGAIAHFIIYGADEQRVAYDMIGAAIDMGYIV